MEDVQNEQENVSSTQGGIHLWVEKYDTLLLEEIAGDLSKITPYELDDCDNKYKVSSDLDAALKGIVEVIFRDKPVHKTRLDALLSSLFSYVDLYMLIIRRLVKRLPELSSTTQYLNLFYCLKCLPSQEKKLSFFFSKKVNFAKPGTKNKRLRRLYQSIWLEFIKLELPIQLLKELVPYLCENALPLMPDGHLFGDFLFSMFQMNDVFAILALEGIFKLMTQYNFEYPDFYPTLYKLTVPSICYMDSRKKFLELLDMFLSSTHLPTYIVAAFVKRLCRLTLVAPLVFQEPLLGLIRNLTTRHEGVRQLLHREEPKVLESDPYDEMEDDMQKCGALESSLWELQAIQKHWCGNVSKRADFVDKGIQNVESFIRWKTEDEHFAAMLSKKFICEESNKGSQENFLQRKQSQWNDGSESNEESDPENTLETADVKQELKRRRKRKTHTSSEKNLDLPMLSINQLNPSNEFFSNKFQLPMYEYWKF